MRIFSLIFFLAALGDKGTSKAAFLLPSTTSSSRATPRSGVEPTTHATALMSIPNPLDTLTSGLASICRLPYGVTVSSHATPNNEIRLLKLYDIENSRPCRKVRERITELDLVVEKVIPAGPDSRAITDPSYNDALPDGATIPCLVASVQGEGQIIMNGEINIVEFLDESFSEKSSLSDTTASSGTERFQSVIEAATFLGSYAASWMRLGRGSKVSPAATSSSIVNRPKKPLILYSYEGNQFCRLVREVLTELDIVYELRSTGKESPRRLELADRTGGSSQCPYIVDPNTGVEMAESADIIRYLYDNYALWTPPNELLEWISVSIMPIMKPVFSSLAPLQAGSSSEDQNEYKSEIEKALAEIQKEVESSPVVIYTYELSPFSFEAKALLDSISVDYKEISLGKEWIPGLIAPGGATKRAALLERTGQSSLPHIFVAGQPIGGLFSGSPGLLPSLKSGTFLYMAESAKTGSKVNSLA